LSSDEEDEEEEEPGVMIEMIPLKGQPLTATPLSPQRRRFRAKGPIPIAFKNVQLL